MAKNRTAQVLAELKTLAKQADSNLYRRIALADEVLQDSDWLATVHGGDDLKAREMLTAEFFRDLGGFISLGKLIQMYRGVCEAQWKEYRYDVAAVEYVYDSTQKKAAADSDAPKQTRTSWKRLAEERQDRIDDLESQIKQLLTANAELREENIELRATAARLEGRLEGRSEEMERSANSRMAYAGR